MRVKLTGAVPVTAYTTDLNAVADTLNGTSLTVLLELCHVAYAREILTDDATDAEIADFLESIEPWASMANDAAREAAVSSARATLATLAAA